MANFTDHIPLLKPWIDEEELQGVLAVLQSGWISQGPVTQQLEQAIARLVGAPHAVAVNSATSALHLAFQTAGLRRGDKVIVPAHTCMATVNAIVMAGGVPVFADIDLRTYNLDPVAAEAALDDEVRAICVVHQIGLPADLDAFVALARRRGLILVEDAATAFGAKYRGRYLGGHGNPTVYSFHPRKMITTAEGGMVVLWDDGADEQARRLRSAGASISDLVRHQARGTLQQTYPEPGYNYRLTDVQAAIGLAQLRKLDRMLQLRAEQATFYNAAFARLEEVVPPYVPPEATHCYSSYCVRLPAANEGIITRILEHMAAAGISCRRGIQPLTREPYFAESHRHVDLPNTEAAAAQTLFLPIFPGLTRPQQERVVEALTEAVRRCLPRPIAVC
ncbi:MAG TPA: DegT/DnrJ/EryC1/StrS family aminotransferase [Gemmataceae bacterium]|nr:DegT/DnrJ/EryC1/StrS family aminotransferase [Gemmataceae bacterium]